MKKKSKIPREQNPYFLTGRGKGKRWSFLRWLLLSDICGEKVSNSAFF
jgi:hypothetical protein